MWLLWLCEIWDFYGGEAVVFWVMRSLSLVGGNHLWDYFLSWSEDHNLNAFLLCNKQIIFLFSTQDATVVAFTWKDIRKLLMVTGKELNQNIFLMWVWYFAMQLTCLVTGSNWCFYSYNFSGFFKMLKYYRICGRKVMPITQTFRKKNSIHFS